jgi:hypothetical protein
MVGQTGIVASAIPVIWNAAGKNYLLKSGTLQLTGSLIEVRRGESSGGPSLQRPLLGSRTQFGIAPFATRTTHTAIRGS